MHRASIPVVALTAAVVMSLCARPAPAAIDAAPSFEQFAQSWMGAVALLAHGGDHDHDDRSHGDRDDGACEQCKGREHGRHGDGERCGCGKDGCERCEREGRGPGRAGPRRRPTGAGPQAAVAKMDEILARLARIEAKLDGRGGMPGRIELRGPLPPAGGPGPRPEMPERARMMEERLRRATEGMSPEDRARMEERMKAARERMRDGGPRPEGRPATPEAAREQMRNRMEEGRERMDQARQAFRQMEERIRKLEAEIERLKADR